MKRSDEKLQSYIIELESGIPLDALLAAMPSEDQELRPLLTMAAVLRDAPDPASDPAVAQTQDGTVMAVIHSSDRYPLVASPSSNGNRLGPIFHAAGTSGLSAQQRLAGGMVFVLALLMLAWILWPAGSVDATATLVDVSGQVEIRDQDQTVGWRQATSGETVSAGQALRTGPASTLTLVFSEGSRTRLAGDTELTLNRLVVSSESLQVELEQHQGRTRHDVVPLRGDDAFYLVLTPGGTAAVHGTVFDVRVADDGTTEFEVTEGEVTVAAAGSEVMVGAGQLTTAASNTPPAAPSEAGQKPRPSLSFIPDEIAAAGCEDVVGLAGTLVNEADGSDDEAVNSFLGSNVIQGSEYIASVAVEPNNWKVIAPGEAVSLAVQVGMNSSWASAPDGTELKLRVFVANEDNRPEHHTGRLTVTITRLCEGTPEPPTVTVTPTITTTPTATMTPTATVTPTVTVTATTTIDCTGNDPHPQATNLAEQYNVPYEEIMGWFCSGYGFGEIALAYELSDYAGVPVAEIFALRETGMGWGQIAQELETTPGNGNNGNAGNGNNGNAGNGNTGNGNNGNNGDAGNGSNGNAGNGNNGSGGNRNNGSNGNGNGGGSSPNGGNGNGKP